MSTTVSRPKRSRTASGRSSTSSRIDEPQELLDFVAFCGELKVEGGAPFALYPGQRRMLREFFEGATETLVLQSKKNGKTTVMAALALYHLIVTPDAECVIAAASRDQAGKMLRACRVFIRQSADLRRLVRMNQREINSLTDEGFIRVLAANEETGDGATPTLALVDELHRHKNGNMYGVLRDGLGPRNGQIITISTAGDDELSALGEMRRKMAALPVVERDGAYRFARSENGDYVMHEWALDPGQDRSDMSVVKTANPAPWLTEEALRRRFESPSTEKWQWARFACGVWVKGESTVISPDEWAQLEERDLEPDRSAWCIGGLDLAWKVDCTALVVLGWEGRERRVVAAVRVLTPPVDESDVVRGLLELQEEFSPEAWVYDPNADGQQMAQLLEKGEHPLQDGGRLDFVEHSQDNAPMALAASRLSEAVRGGWLRHDGNQDLRRHVLNAVRHDLGGEKWKFDRPKDAKGARRAKYPIDALTALLMAHSVAVAQRDVGEPLVAFA